MGLPVRPGAPRRRNAASRRRVRTDTAVQRATSQHAAPTPGVIGGLERPSDGPDVLGPRAFWTLAGLERHGLTFAKAVELYADARRLVEEVLAAILAEDETEPFLPDEPLNRAADWCHVTSEEVGRDRTYRIPLSVYFSANSLSLPAVVTARAPI